MRALSLTIRMGCVGALVLLAGCANPRAEAATAQALNDAANEISGLKNDLADVRGQVDSLRATVAKQDTVIARIAEVNHIPIK